MDTTASSTFLASPGWGAVLDAAVTGDGDALAALGAHDSFGTWCEPPTAEALRRQVPDGVRPAFPLPVKANISVACFALSGATPALAGNRRELDAPVVAALREHGAVVTGTANMHELAYGITSENAAYGAVRNPVDGSFSAGGSSGGSAAAVARGYAPVALGTDTGGSVSIPAAVCGVVGFRPTVGRWPAEGLIGLSSSRDTAGVFARTVADAATVDGWISGAVLRSGAGADGLPERMGIPAELVVDLDPETARAFTEACTRLEAAGVEVVETSLGPVPELVGQAHWDIVAWESHHLLRQAAAEALGEPADEAWKALVAGAASADVRGLLQGLNDQPPQAEHYRRAVALMWRARAEYQALLAAADLPLLLFPATPRPATPLGGGMLVEHLGTEHDVFGLMTRNATAGTLLRSPMLTQPMAPAADGRPQGVTLQGVAHADASVLAAGAAVEAVLRG